MGNSEATGPRGRARRRRRSGSAPSGAAPELVEASPLRYLVRTPTLRSDRSVPMLCFLHGYDEGAPVDIFDGLTRHGPLRPADGARHAERFVIVAPQLPVAGDLWQRYATAVRRIIVEEARRHRCDEQRIHLTGFSFGGNGVFDLAIAEPELWAALWPVDPTRLPLGPIDKPIWLSLGEASRRKTRAFVHALALEPPDPAGNGDRVWSDEGEDHAGTAAAAYRDTRIYEWLLSKRR